MRALLKQRADVNAAEADGTTALHWAVRADDLETAQLLIRAGANVKAANRYGVTPLSLAATNGNARDDRGAAQGRRRSEQRRCPRARPSLMTAARTGKADAVKVLLARGANVNAKERWQGETALMWAAAENHAAAVKALVEAGADIERPFESAGLPRLPLRDQRHGRVELPRGGWTALMYAARQDCDRCASAVLADAEADLNADAIRRHDGAASWRSSTPTTISPACCSTRARIPNVADTHGMTALYAAVDMRTPAD